MSEGALLEQEEACSGTFLDTPTSEGESSISARDGKQVSALALAAEGTVRNEIPGMSRKYPEETSGTYYGAEKWCPFHFPSLVKARTRST